MRKALSTLVTIFFVGSHSQAAPLEKDERDVLRSAHVYHIMGLSQAPLEKLGAQLRGVPADRLLDEFKQLARAKSSDPGSAPSGGDIGLVVEGTMDDKFDAAVFSQQPMQVSSPQRSAFGWHLILVTSAQQEPIQGICERSLREAQRAAPITPTDLFRFSLERQSPENLHPTVLQYIGEGWGTPMNRDNNLAYLRVESDFSKPTMAKLVMHTEMPFARYNSSPSACRRSARDIFQVDCVASTVALISHVEYEGRGAAGRRLVNVEYGQAKRMFQPAKTGFLSQIVEHACARLKQ